MADHCWVEEFPGAIIVCDCQGVILEMNDRAVAAYEKEGGRKLLGSNLLDCHPEPSRAKVKRLLESQQANVYTVEKRGVRRLIYQSPWYVSGAYGGLVELSLEIPAAMPHFTRDA
jgi:PAS domain-containing protein